MTQVPWGTSIERNETVGDGWKQIVLDVPCHQRSKLVLLHKSQKNSSSALCTFNYWPFLKKMHVNKVQKSVF